MKGITMLLGAAMLLTVPSESEYSKYMSQVKLHPNLKQLESQFESVHMKRHANKIKIGSEEAEAKRIRKEKKMAKKDAKIVGGETTTPDKYPWIVSLMIEETGYYPYHFCGGSLIRSANPAVVLTAAHCVYDLNLSNNETFQVNVGRKDVDDYDEEDFVTANVVMWVNDTYNGVTSERDVALLLLDRGIEDDGDDWETIELWFGHSQDELSVGDTMTVVGYGADSDGDLTETLEDVELGYTDQDDCNDRQNLYLYCNDEDTCDGVDWDDPSSSGSGSPTFTDATDAGYTSTQIYEDMICAWATNKDSCQGDSGGPMVYGTSKNSPQVGIVSWGYGCAIGPPGVYADVMYFEDWIVEHFELILEAAGCYCYSYEFFDCTCYDSLADVPLSTEEDDDDDDGAGLSGGGSGGVVVLGLLVFYLLCFM